ncbi:hypothetical protein, partial [Gardnerella vaginalis]|uniref:hypothetical protein n=1 Tax=Gardnerella vaginalis TaxID=2702 RepID=UPI00197AB426
PPPQAFYFKGFCEIIFSKILAILASRPPFLAHSSKHLYMIQITFLDPIQRAFFFYPAFVPIFGVSINKFRNTPRTIPSKANRARYICIMSETNLTKLSQKTLQMSHQ